jgi:hypothetical protein
VLFSTSLPHDRTLPILSGIGLSLSGASDLMADELCGLGTCLVTPYPHSGVEVEVNLEDHP